MVELLKSYRVLWRLQTALCLFLCLFVGTVIADSSRIVARVNGEPVTAGRVDLLLEQLELTPQQQREQFDQAVQTQIDRTLIHQFLQSRRISAPTATIDRQLALVEKMLAREEDPEQKLKSLGMTRKELQAELSLPLAWRRYVREVITEQQIADYFEAHQRELDGTQLVVRQIFLKLPPDADESLKTAKRQKLKAIREKLTPTLDSFAEAAKQHSESPSAQQGGKLGTFTATGNMPAIIIEHAFRTPVGELSKVFVSRFGVHLLYIEEEVSGQFSPEDARPAILNRLSEKLWTETVERLRRTAEIELTN